MTLEHFIQAILQNDRQKIISSLDGCRGFLVRYYERNWNFTRADAEDLAQELVLKMLKTQSFKTIQDKNRVKSWLLKVAANHAKTKIRKPLIELVLTDESPENNVAVTDESDHSKGAETLDLFVKNPPAPDMDFPLWEVQDSTARDLLLAVAPKPWHRAIILLGFGLDPHNEEWHALAQYTGKDVNLLQDELQPLLSAHGEKLEKSFENLCQRFAWMLNIEKKMKDAESQIYALSIIANVPAKTLEDAEAVLTQRRALYRKRQRLYLEAVNIKRLKVNANHISDVTGISADNINQIMSRISRKLRDLKS